MRVKSKHKHKHKHKPYDKLKDLQHCRKCQQKLYHSDCKKEKKKYLEEIPCIWGGVERPYEQVFKVNCPNPSCKMRYSVKIKKSDWLYK